MKVTIGRVTQGVEVQPTVVLPQSVYTVNAGDSLEIVPEVYPAGVAEGTWSIVSGEGVVTVEENTVTAKKTGEAVLRYTLDTADGLDDEAVYAECRILVREAPAFVRGDADGDGKADISDLRLVLRHVCWKIRHLKRRTSPTMVKWISRICARSSGSCAGRSRSYRSCS